MSNPKQRERKTAGIIARCLRFMSLNSLKAIVAFVDAALTRWTKERSVAAEMAKIQAIPFHEHKQYVYADHNFNGCKSLLNAVLKIVNSRTAAKKRRRKNGKVKEGVGVSGNS